MKIKGASAVLVLALWFVAIRSGRAQTENKKWNVAIFMFESVQIIDYSGPYEVFVNASANNHARFNIYTVAGSDAPLKTVGGMTILPAYTFDTMPKPDILVVPGGWGVYAERKKPQVIEWLRKTSAQAQITMSVCNGAFFLSKAGLLDGLRVTTTAGALQGLKKEVPSVILVPEARFVDNGRIVMSAGLSAGIDAALHVVSKVLGPGWAQRIAVDMEYDWQPNSGYSRALLADGLLPGPHEMPDGLREPFSYTGDKNHWEMKTLLQDNLTPTEAFEQVTSEIERYSNVRGWVEPHVVPGEIPLQRAWRFRDRLGIAWQATLKISTQTATQGTTLVMVVEKTST